ncbi:MAG TPA: ATP-binding protein [Rhodopila sp.]|nr:ATP-binding protein [Rhodopila sp.]
MSLLARLFVLVIFALLPSLGVQIYNELDARQARARIGEEQALRNARLIADTQSRVFQGTHQLLTSLGKIAAWSNGSSRCDALFAELRQAYPEYTVLASFDLTGAPTCASLPDPSRHPRADAEYFRLALQTDSYVIGSYSVDVASGVANLYVAQPFRKPDGAIAGVVVAGLAVDWLNQELAEKPLPSHATVSMVDRHGTIVARHPGADRFVGQPVAGGSHSYMLSGGEGVREAMGFDGIARIYAYTPLPDGPSGLAISVGLEKADILQDADAANRRGLLVIPAQAGLAFLLTGLGGRIFLRKPLTKLLRAADRLRQGDLRARVRFSESRTEFGRLGAAFDTMADAIATREEELERRVNERTRALQDAMAAQHSAEAALQKAQRMEAIGRLTGGVAHDFNNLLAAIVGNIELALSRTAKSYAAAQNLQSALASAQYGARLIQQLLAFARRQTLRPEVIDLNRQLAASFDLLRRQIGSDIKVTADLASDLWLVRADPGQLEAAVLNLAFNARDAMPQGGVLQIQTRNVTLLGDAAPEHLRGDFVALTLRDTGTGIAPEHIDKVFEPFFTTKPIGRGSGLGLSMVHGFVRQSAGGIAIQSTVSVGTAVTLYFPHTPEIDQAHARAPSVQAAGEHAAQLPRGENTVAPALSHMLRQLGYGAASAQDAVETAMLMPERRGA